jgi:phosphoglycolate phosphatase-like HAD superfamily hydrolase
MNQHISNSYPFRTLVFDCDGVILNSNRIKTDAFRSVALRFGPDAAEALVQFHVQHGGVSRYHKFEYLLTNILGRARNEQEVQTLASAYGECVYSELLKCEIADDIYELRKVTADQAWMVVSGGDEVELRRVFEERGLNVLFERGIHGSPATKDTILKRELSTLNLELPALFLGDSRYDHEASQRAGLQFVFVHGWSEFHGWEAYCASHQIPTIETLADVRSVLSDLTPP